MLNVADECGERYRRMYEDGERGELNEYMIVGSALDASVTADLQQKLKHGLLLSDADAVSIAHESVRMAFTQPRAPDKALRPYCYGRAESLARYAHKMLSPNVHVVSVQEPWSIRLDAMLRKRGGVRGRWSKIDFVGTLDIREHYYDFSSTEPAGFTIRDIKSAGASPPENSADGKHWLQLTSYALGMWVKHHEMPRRVQIDSLVTLKSGIVHKPSVGERNDFDIAALFNRCVRFAQMRQAGLYMPAPRGHWRCTKTWCQFYDTCCFVKNKKTIELALPPTRLYKIHVTNASSPASLVEMPRRVQCEKQEPRTNPKTEAFREKSTN